jgi:peptidoglycan/LPS O-acetylase OafA/YrhL
MKTKKLIWKLCRLAAIGLSILVFTPLVIPKGIYLPLMFGLPYTLWMGMISYALYIILIVIGVYLHSQIYREAKNDG